MSQKEEKMGERQGLVKQHGCLLLPLT
jgi:hypothetical protein